MSTEPPQETTGKDEPPAGGRRVTLEDPPESLEEPRPRIDPDKKKRRGSMFEEAATMKDILPKNPEPGDISTLQAFFKEPTLLNEDRSGGKKTKLRRPKLTLENTYLLESQNPFVPSRMEALIKSTLVEMLFDLRYCSKTASTTCALVAETIRNRVLDCEYDRYKLVVHVALGSMSRQGFCIAFKHLGDPVRDVYAQGSFINHHVFAAASVHAVYYE